MKKEFVRRVVAFEDHFREFRKTLDKAEALMKKYYEQKDKQSNEERR